MGSFKARTGYLPECFTPVAFLFQVDIWNVKLRVSYVYN